MSFISVGLLKQIKELLKAAGETMVFHNPKRGQLVGRIKGAPDFLTTDTAIGKLN
jgi:hypothetical protein